MPQYSTLNIKIVSACYKNDNLLYKNAIDMNDKKESYNKNLVNPWSGQINNPFCFIVFIWENQKQKYY